MNSLTETIKDIQRFGYSVDDVVVIKLYNGKKCATWNEFTTIANFDYDDGYGTQRINSNLVIVLNDGSYLERREYDGSEWWLWRKAPSAENNGVRLTYEDLQNE